METLITLIIVVVAALLSKKKKDRGAALPEEKTTLPSSPWDDLIREIQSGRSDASPKGGEATSGGDRGEYAAEVSAEPATEAAAPATARTGKNRRLPPIILTTNRRSTSWTEIARTFLFPMTSSRLPTGRPLPWPLRFFPVRAVPRSRKSRRRRAEFSRTDSIRRWPCCTPK